MNKQIKTFTKGDIVYADLGYSVKSELGGIRPVLILRVNQMENQCNYHTYIIAAITTRQNMLPLSSHIPVDGNGLAKNATIVLNQVRTINPSRFLHYVGSLDRETCYQIDALLRTSIDFVL